MKRRAAPALLAAALVAASAPQASSADAALAPLIGAIRWGEASDAIAGAFGARALRLKPPIEFGDSFVDVALRDQRLGGYGFAVYFQMDKATHRLKRVMLERQRHGASPTVFAAVIAALERDYGAPQAVCGAGPARANGYQATGERDWQAGGLVIRAVFQDTTLEAGQGCITAAPGAACGLTGHLYLQIYPPGNGTTGCRGGP